MKKLAKDQIQKIIELYNSGTPPKEIGETFGIYNNSVTRLLRKNGIERNQLCKPTDEMEQKAITDYNNGISSEQIAIALGIDGGTVRRILRNNGVAIRPSTQNKRRYQIKLDFFENIDTEEKAYFLGFLYADGNVSKSSAQITVCLHEQDLELLEKFSNILYGFVKKMTKSTVILKDGNVGTYYSFGFYGKKIKNDLVKHGCVPNKSFILTFPNFLRNNLYSHFIRGYVDGDGCLSLTRRPVIDITSTLSFLEGLTSYLDAHLGIKIDRFGIRHPDRDTSTRNIQITNREDVTKFLDYLYSNATIYMQRKYNSYQQILAKFEDRDTKKISRYVDLTKYGTSYIPEWNNNLLTSQYLKTISVGEKEEMVEYLFSFYRTYGFPYTKLTTDEIVKDFTALQNSDPSDINHGKIITLYNQSGINIFKHFSPHFYEVKSGSNPTNLSMLEAFNDDATLKKVIMNRLTGNYNMTGNMLKQGLPNSKQAYKASIFNPTAAKFIYSQFTKENSIIYDYSMGFGQRLLGALSLSYPITYIGVDPWCKCLDSNQKIFDTLSKNIPLFKHQAELHCCGSEHYCDPKYIGKIDIAFSSPPYFKLETYTDEHSQAYSQGYAHFINQWWRKTVDNIDRLLAPNGIFALNMKEQVMGFNIAENMCGVIKEKGFTLKDTYSFQLSRNTKFGGVGEIKLEPVFIFQK